jgi:hypothetical protein
MKSSRKFIGLFVAALGTSMFVGTEAKAEIRDAFVNDFGDIEITFVDNAPPLRQFDYLGRSQVAATYVCARGNRPHPNPSRRQTINSVLERTERFQSDFSGRVNGVLTLNHPGQAVSLTCPGSFSPRLASVRYTRIELRSELGISLFQRDVTRTFIALR